MGDVKLTSPLTGTAVTLTDEDDIAAHRNQGWQDASVRAPRQDKQPDVPDVEAGRKALRSGNGTPDPDSAKDAPAEKPKRTSKKADSASGSGDAA